MLLSTEYVDADVEVTDGGAILMEDKKINKKTKCYIYCCTNNLRLQKVLKISDMISVRN